MGCDIGVEGWPLGSGRRRLSNAPQSGEHRRLGVRGAHPSRNSQVRNAETPSRSGRRVVRWADRKES